MVHQGGGVGVGAELGPGTVGGVSTSSTETRQGVDPAVVDTLLVADTDTAVGQLGPGGDKMQD